MPQATLRLALTAKPVPLPQRMWAGDRLRFEQPLRVGDPIHRDSRIESVRHKLGRSGDLVFVVVEHRFTSPTGLAITEEHDIVYRDLAPPDTNPSPAIKAPVNCSWEQVIEPDDTLLFRYSALTFNGHRIHYDRRYVTEVQGYPGLVVHGPLIATLLIELLRHNCLQATAERFEFRALRPLFDTEPFTVRGQPIEHGRTVRLWAQNPDAELAMDALATLR